MCGPTMLTVDFDCSHCGAKAGYYHKGRRVPGEWCKKPDGSEAKHIHADRKQQFQDASRARKANCGC